MHTPSHHQSDMRALNGGSDEGTGGECAGDHDPSYKAAEDAVCRPPAPPPPPARRANVGAIACAGPRCDGPLPHRGVAGQGLGDCRGGPAVSQSHCGRSFSAGEPPERSVLLLP